MKTRDTNDALTGALALVCDALAVFGGLMLATWIRLGSGWMALKRLPPPNFYSQYALGAVLATLAFLFIFHTLGLYRRPQTGSFVDKIPRLVRGCGLGVLATFMLAFAVIHMADFSRLTIAMAYPAVLFLVLLERYILYRIEWNVARHSQSRNHILILGTDPVAAHLKQTLQREKMLRANVLGFLQTDYSDPDPSIPADKIMGSMSELANLVAAHEVDQIILTNSRLGHERIVEIIMLCERNMITFNMVPDLFRVLTSSMDVQSLDDIPLLGISRWPLDYFWRRTSKRVEDILGSALGLLLYAPAMAVAAVLIKRSSAGPVFYRQERCGENGKIFNLFKLRTMRQDAEVDSGPVFTAEDDPRTTPIGAYLRRHNLDEVPQLWNVLKGEMSLVGPRPERPHFVEKFKGDISRYMWRHVSKPGMTGWAQVNGLRGNTSIEERIKYDLYYLENWSLSFDFKILGKTVFAHKNAY